MLKFFHFNDSEFEKPSDSSDLMVDYYSCCRTILATYLSLLVYWGESVCPVLPWRQLSLEALAELPEGSGWARAGDGDS